MMQRTIRLQLLPTIEQESALRETLSLYASCYNAVTSYGWASSETNGVSLHHATSVGGAITGVRPATFRHIAT